MKLYDPFSAAVEAVEVSQAIEALIGSPDADLIALESKRVDDALADFERVVAGTIDDLCRSLVSMDLQ